MWIDETKLSERERAILTLLREMYAFYREMYAFYNDGHHDNNPGMDELHDMIIRGFDILADDKEKGEEK